ncbi:salicylate synthase [Streptosporangium sp. CA-135522]|uniref:salicylate synthase n=1 Tax=Streptosporangium sp. CA-135522 TaxID=3240072 RepID=UPI003D8D0EB7
MPQLAYREREVAFTADPVATAAHLARNSPGAHLVYEGRGEMAWADGDHLTLSVTATGTTISGPGAVPPSTTAGTPLESLAEALQRIPLRGWRAYGWAVFELGYHLHDLHDLPADPGGEALAHLFVPAREIRLRPGTALLRALDPADLDRLERLIGQGAEQSRHDRLTLDVDAHDGPAYRRAVTTAVAEIGLRRLDKVILSRVVPVPDEIDLPATYLAGRRGNQPARSFLLRLGGWEAAGFSPEIVARIDADGVVLTQPLAGTRALDGRRDLDDARRQELYRDAKEVYEHAISVRLAAEELARVCTPDSVQVDDFMSIKERGSVQHLASQVSGRLTPGRTGWHALAALFPAVTASGIPKAPACDLIRRTESETRGLYSGAVLTADADGTIDAALVLRSVFRRDGRTWLRAGAGVVQQSTPDREFEETCEKLRSVSLFLVPATAVPVRDTARHTLNPA